MHAVQITGGNVLIDSRIDFLVDTGFGSLRISIEGGYSFGYISQNEWHKTLENIHGLNRSTSQQPSGDSLILMGGEIDDFIRKLAPRAGLEPATLRLTVAASRLRTESY